MAAGFTQGMHLNGAAVFTWWSSSADIVAKSPDRFLSIPLVSRRLPGHAFSCRIIRMTSTRVFQPHLPNGALRALTSVLTQHTGRKLMDSLRHEAAIANEQEGPFRMEATAIFRVLADLIAIGWQIRVVRSNLYLIPRRLQSGDLLQAKHAVRETLLETRNQQLNESPTIEFFRQMHTPRSGAGNDISIDSLIDDGSDLVRALQAGRSGELSGIVKPYIQFVDAKKRCEHTGLLLNDIWRYIRHTWSLEFRPTPGRNLNYLIRNAARPNHPVIGIVGLSNAIFQLTTRDEWIGWTEPSVMDRVKRDPAEWPEFLTAAIASLDASRKLIRADDLMKEAGKPKTHLEISRRFGQIAEEQDHARTRSLRERHSTETDALPSPRRIPKNGDGSIDWRTASESPLFKRKRADTLSAIHFALHHLKCAPTNGAEIVKQMEVVQRPDGKQVRWHNSDLGKSVRTAIREIKKNGVASRILDVNVCGAAPTYGDLLGGKLAAMSLFSSEVQDAYIERYANSPSEIASAMAGRPVSKKSHVCILTTTSLYGVGSSQYNRVRVRFGNRSLNWIRIGETEGFGSVHFSKTTIESVRRLAIERRGMRNVNNVFGEGTSPLMRQMREGLSLLGFEPDDVLQHANQRIVYAAEMYPEARRDLVADRDSYARGPGFTEIADDWHERWLRMRIQNDDVLHKVAKVSALSVNKIW